MRKAETQSACPRMKSPSREDMRAFRSADNAPLTRPARISSGQINGQLSFALFVKMSKAYCKRRQAERFEFFWKTSEQDHRQPMLTGANSNVEPRKSSARIRPNRRASHNTNADSPFLAELITVSLPLEMKQWNTVKNNLAGIFLS